MTTSRSRRRQAAYDAETRWLLSHPAPRGLLATVWRTQGKPLPMPMQDYDQYRVQPPRTEIKETSR